MTLKMAADVHTQTIKNLLSDYNQHANCSVAGNEQLIALTDPGPKLEQIAKQTREANARFEAQQAQNKPAAPTPEEEMRRLQQGQPYMSLMKTPNSSPTG